MLVLGLCLSTEEPPVSVLAREREQGLAEMRRGVNLWRKLSGNFHMTHWLSEFVDCLLQADQNQEADCALQEAEQISANTDEQSHAAELRRLRGHLWEIKGDSEQASVCCQQALQWSRSHEAKLFGLRAAISLARLIRDQGRRTEARELLAPVYGWFTEGFDASDLKDAKALLNELA